MTATPPVGAGADEDLTPEQQDQIQQLIDRGYSEDQAQQIVAAGTFDLVVNAGTQPVPPEERVRSAQQALSGSQTPASGPGSPQTDNRGGMLNAGGPESAPPLGPQIGTWSPGNPTGQQGPTQTQSDRDASIRARYTATGMADLSSAEQQRLLMMPPFSVPVGGGYVTWSNDPAQKPTVPKPDESTGPQPFVNPATGETDPNFIVTPDGHVQQVHDPNAQRPSPYQATSEGVFDPNSGTYVSGSDKPIPAGEGGVFTRGADGGYAYSQLPQRPTFGFDPSGNAYSVSFNADGTPKLDYLNANQQKTLKSEGYTTVGDSLVRLNPDTGALESQRVGAGPAPGHFTVGRTAYAQVYNSDTQQWEDRKIGDVPQDLHFMPDGQGGELGIDTTTGEVKARIPVANPHKRAPIVINGQAYDPDDYDKGIYTPVGPPKHEAIQPFPGGGFLIPAGQTMNMLHENKNTTLAPFSVTQWGNGHNGDVVAQGSPLQVASYVDPGSQDLYSDKASWQDYYRGVQGGFPPDQSYQPQQQDWGGAGYGGYDQGGWGDGQDVGWGQGVGVGDDPVGQPPEPTALQANQAIAQNAPIQDPTSWYLPHASQSNPMPGTQWQLGQSLGRSPVQGTPGSSLISGAAAPPIPFGSGEDGPPTRENPWDDDKAPSASYDALVGWGSDGGHNGGWVSPVAPEHVVGTGHKWLEPVSMEGIHKGVDVQAYQGTPVVAPVDGQVSDVKFDPRGLGLQVSVTGGDGDTHKMSHLLHSDVRPGQAVGRGEGVAEVGSTGAGSTGPHLDYRIIGPQGEYKDPSPLLGPLAEMPRADKPTGEGGDWLGAGADVLDEGTGWYYDDQTGEYLYPADDSSGSSDLPSADNSYQNSDFGTNQGSGATSSDPYGGYDPSSNSYSNGATYDPNDPNDPFNQTIDMGSEPPIDPTTGQPTGGGAPGSAGPPTVGGSNPPTTGSSTYANPGGATGNPFGGTYPTGSQYALPTSFGTPTRPATSPYASTAGQSTTDPAQLALQQQSLNNQYAAQQAQYQQAQAQLAFDKQVHGDTVDYQQQQLALDTTWHQQQSQYQYDSLNLNAALQGAQMYQQYTISQNSDQLQRDLASANNNISIQKLQIDGQTADWNQQDALASLAEQKAEHGDSQALQTQQMQITSDYNNNKLALDTQTLGLQQQQVQFNQSNAQAQLDQQYAFHADDVDYKNATLSLQQQSQAQQAQIAQAQIGIAQQQAAAQQMKDASDAAYQQGQLGLGQQQLAATTQYQQAEIALAAAKQSSDAAWQQVQGQIAEGQLALSTQQTAADIAYKTAQTALSQGQLQLGQQGQQIQQQQFGQTLAQQQQQQQDTATYQQGQLALGQGNLAVSQGQLQATLDQNEKNYQLGLQKLQQDYQISQNTDQYNRDKMALDNAFQEQQLSATTAYQNASLAQQASIAQSTNQTNVDIQGTFAQKQAAALQQSALANPWLQQLTGMTPSWNQPGGPGTNAPASTTPASIGGTSQAAMASGASGGTSNPDSIGQAMGGAAGWTSTGPMPGSAGWTPPSYQQYAAETPFERAADRTKVEMNGGPGAWDQVEQSMRQAWGQAGGPTTAPNTAALSAAGQNATQKIGTEQLANTFGQTAPEYWQQQGTTWSKAKTGQVSQSA